MREWKAGKRLGFTLIELLVVIAIIAILAAMIMPALERARDLAKLSSCLGNNRQIYLGISMYVNSHDGQLPAGEYVTSGIASEAWRNSWGWGDSHDDPDTFRIGTFGVLLKGDYVSTSELLVCPGTDNISSALMNYPVEDWPITYGDHMGATAYANYAIHPGNGGSLVREEDKVVLMAEGIGAFHDPKMSDTSQLHGHFPLNGTASAQDNIELPPMNMMFFDGRVESVYDWGNPEKYPWHLRDYYFPANDRSSWGFWTVFPAHFK